MRPHELLAGLLLCVCIVAPGCKRLTFIKPDPNRQNYTQIAPDYNVRSDAGSKKRMAVIDRLTLAEQRLQAGQLEQAETETRAALKIDSRSSDAYTLLAVIESARGNGAQSGAYYAKAAELAPGKGSALNNYGAWLCGNGRPAEALAYFDRALADPTYLTPASAQANAGACALDAGQVERAERDLRAAVRQAPENPVALGGMARLKFQRGEYFEARAFSQRRLAAGTNSREALLLASQIEEKLGDKAAAARYVQSMQALQQQAPTQRGTSRP